MFAADFTLKWLFSSVEVLVFDRVSAHGKRLSANLTLVFGGTFMGFDMHLNVVL